MPFGQRLRLFTDFIDHYLIEETAASIIPTERLKTKDCSSWFQSDIIQGKNHVWLTLWCKFFTNFFSVSILVSREVFKVINFLWSSFRPSILCLSCTFSYSVSCKVFLTCCKLTSNDEITDSFLLYSDFSIWKISEDLDWKYTNKNERIERYG